MKILFFVGGISRESLNRKIFHAMAVMSPLDVEIATFPIEELPFFSQDQEKDLPSKVRELKDTMEIADGIVFITPEYNRSIPGVLKNAIDWASRPYGKNSFKGKMVAVLGASPGNVGTFGAQNHLDAILSYLEAMTMAQPETYLKVGDAFDAQGELTDPILREILQLFWASFMTWIERHDAAGNGTHARHMGETPSAPLS